MDTLDAMRVFAAVAERSGFSAAADALDRSTASVTRQVAALEQRLGTRLLNRTTRRVSLTSAGTAYYQRCLQLLADLDDLEATVGAQALEPAGVLRVNAPVSYGIERLAALLPGFARATRRWNWTCRCRTGWWTWSKKASMSPSASPGSRRRR